MVPYQAELAQFEQAFLSVYNCIYTTTSYSVLIDHKIILMHENKRFVDQWEFELLLVYSFIILEGRLHTQLQIHGYSNSSRKALPGRSSEIN